MSAFKQAAEPDADGYYATALAADSMQAGEMQAVEINGQKIVLAMYDNKLYALTSVCPHAAADLATGELSRWKLFCPDHGYCFDIRNGRIAWPEDEVYRLKKYEIKVSDGEIYLKM